MVHLVHSYAHMYIKADKALSGASGGFSFFGGREDKYQNAADLYIQAANAFRMQKSSASCSRCCLNPSGKPSLTDKC